MSHVFDSIHDALETLKSSTQPKPGLEELYDELFTRLRFVIYGLHEVSHSHEDWLNRSPHLSAELRQLDACLQEERDKISD